MIYLKSAREIQILKEGGHILATILREVSEEVVPGVTTAALNAKAERLLSEYGVDGSFKGYMGTYPSALCTSVNEEVVHGIPSDRVLNDGDIVGLDLGVLYKGGYTDSAITVGVGRMSDQVQRLIDVTKKSLAKGIAAMGPRSTLGDIGAAIQEYVESQGFNVVRDLVGHGVGTKVHEAPQIPNYGTRGTGMQLEPGMVLALEPMVVTGEVTVKCLPDEWTFVTLDGSLSAHFEHTIAVTHYGYEILTLE